MRAMSLNMGMLASYDQSVELFEDQLSFGEASTVVGASAISGFFAAVCILPFDYASSLAFLAVLIISLVMGIVLNYTMFLYTIINSSLTTTIAGVLKGVGSTTLGFVLLGCVQVHPLNLTGLIINTTSGLWYSYAKFQQR
ncbi:hypothetical protein GIB67_026902 [Kingdonia uniflora]|uniref:Uncharacterized protein n=1 Tax=Kingdonia uniflora TaxID=39325 RepID=A0A7J7M7W1_9MAGN|nr:hypothetical protein GIB67_026902 [Kingdonia uniflora]